MGVRWHKLRPGGKAHGGGQLYRRAGVQDYMGTPIQAIDSKGEVVWDCILGIYGEVFRLRGKRDFIPFRFQGEYEDQETGL